jgi:hypothetical protein
MNDSSVRELARRAGVAVQWTDRFGKRHRVSLDTIRHILAALQLPCQTPDDIRHSRRALDNATIPPLVTATLGRVIDLPWRMPDAPPRARLIRDDGAATDVLVRQTSQGIRLQGVKAIGYHTLDIGQARTTLAVAPARCIGIADIANRERLAGVAAQIYGLRHAGDCGIGDMSGVAALAQAAAARGLESVALSTPCSPRSRASSVHIRRRTACSTILSMPMQRRFWATNAWRGRGLRPVWIYQYASWKAHPLSIGEHRREQRWRFSAVCSKILPLLISPQIR